jgi:hypothetical protein
MTLTKFVVQVENILLPKKKYKQAVYECNTGYRISSRTGDSMFCQEFTWTGLEVSEYICTVTRTEQHVLQGVHLDRTRGQ